VLALTAVWALGLWFYSFMLTGSIPGLGRGQAITVNVTGSAVSNLLPFGGALGFAVSLAMLRSWGFPASTFALSAVVTGIWNVLAKLALPLFGLLGLLAVGDVAGGRLLGATRVAAVLLGVALAVLIGALSSERVALALGRAGDALTGLLLRLVRRPRDPDRPRRPDAVARWRREVTGLLRAGWTRMTFGLVGFLGTQAVLLYLILFMLGSRLTPAQVFAGYAFGRLLTTLVITPGGVGITETGVAGLLTAFGGDPAVCVSAVLLFSGFAVFAEFPAGAVGYLVWLTRRSWRRDSDPASRT